MTRLGLERLFNKNMHVLLLSHLARQRDSGKLEGNYRQPYAHSAANCSNVAYKLVLFYRPVLSGSCLCTRTRDCETSDLSLPMKTA